MSYCVECGPNVAVDEDGCCAGCGGNAMGPYAKKACEAMAKAADLTRRIRLAKKMLLVGVGPIITGTTAWRLLDLRWKLERKPLSRRTKRTKTP